MFKLTSRTKVEEMKNILNANFGKVKKKDKTLADQITYAGKHEETATKKDLFDLTKQVVDLLGDKLVVPALAEEPVEKVEKTSKKKLTKADSEKAVKPQKKQTKTETEQVAEPENKSAKKSAKKADGVTDLEASSKKAVPLAEMFPSTLTVGEETYEIARDIETMEDLYNALNDEQEIVLAYYWNKRHLKQFPYYMGLLGQPKSFENDLDLATVIYVSDEKRIAFSVSMYTEAPYSLLPVDLKEEDGLRFADGIEYQIYRKN